MGTMAVDGPDLEKAHAELNAKINKDMLRWRNALLNSSDVRARAAGLLIDGRFDEDSFGKPPSQPALDSLVQLARETHDPAVYAIALAACEAAKPPTSGSSCDSISRQGWSELEPDNAAPWLALAGAARASNDPEAEKAALAQAVKARKVEGYNWSLFGFTESDMPSDVSPLERWLLSGQMIGMEPYMFSPLMPTVVTSKLCSAEKIQDDFVRGQCSQLAELFVKQGTTVADLSIGTSIGERTGWPKARAAALNEEKAALEEIWLQAEPSPAKHENDYSCETAMRRNYLLHERAQLGEMAAAREALSLSDRTKLELAQSYQEYVKQLMQRAAQLNTQ